jgi:outer membrane receptor protein involved in Fe transport
VNLISDYKVQDDFSVFARIQNLANQKYESSYGFYDEGINASTGFEYQF